MRRSDGPQGNGGTPTPDISVAARAAGSIHTCGARTRKGGVCRQLSMANGRCRFHGGLSTGPKTTEGLERCRRARWVHGHRSKGARKALADLDDLLTLVNLELDYLDAVFADPGSVGSRREVLKAQIAAAAQRR